MCRRPRICSPPGKLEPALAEAQAAVGLAPDAVPAQLMLGDVLLAMGRSAEARATYEKALALAKTVERISGAFSSIEQKLADK